MFPAGPLLLRGLFLLVQIQAACYLYNRIVLHQRSQRRGLALASMPFAAQAWAFFTLWIRWDFTSAGWPLLPAPVRWTFLMECALAAVLVLRRMVWMAFTRRKVTWRAMGAEKLRAHAPAPLAFLSRIGIPNQLYDLRVQKYEVEPPAWPAAWAGLTVAHLTDLHHGRWIPDAYLERVRRETLKLKPELIALTGDFVSTKRDIPNAFRWMKGLRAPLGVWAVLGNHDGWEDVESARRELRRAGVRELRNTSVRFRRKGVELALMGAEDLWTGRQDPEALQSSARGAKAKILLAHQPDQFFLGKRLGVQLQLSGHCHGGQVCLPVLGPVVAPSKFGTRYASGFFREGNSVMFVSRGVGAYPPLRTFCPPELALLRLASPD